MNTWQRIDAALAQAMVTTFTEVFDAIRPLCPHCDGEGGHISGYYEPEFDECPCCNADGNAPDGPTRRWRWQWWGFRFRQWREARRLEAWVDVRLRHERDLRFGENPEHWQ